MSEDKYWRYEEDENGEQEISFIPFPESDSSEKILLDPAMFEEFGIDLSTEEGLDAAAIMIRRALTKLKIDLETSDQKET